jgi:exodeoxyribonuclease VII large subunit
MHLRTRLSAQLPSITVHRVRLTDSTHRIATRMTVHAAQRRQALSSLVAQLELLNPQRTLERGYAIIANERGDIIRNPRQIKPGQQLDMTMAEGAAKIGITSVQPKLA